MKGIACAVVFGSYVVAGTINQAAMVGIDGVIAVASFVGFIGFVLFEGKR